MSDTVEDRLKRLEEVVVFLSGEILKLEERLPRDRLAEGFQRFMSRREDQSERT